MRHFIFILLILSSFLVQGQVILRASTSPFPNSNLYVGISNSQLTQNLTFISESKTNHNGGFQVEINNRFATDYSELFICIQNTMALIYVEPDGKYSITYSEEDTLSTHNGFIKQWSLLVEEEATIPFNAILSSFELDLANFTDSIFYPYIKQYTAGNTAVKKRIQENSVNFAGSLANNDSLLQLESQVELRSLTSMFQTKIRSKYELYMRQSPLLTSHIESSLLAFKFDSRNHEFGSLIKPYFNLKSKGFCQIIEIWSNQLLSEILGHPEQADQFKYLLASESNLQSFHKLVNSKGQGDFEMNDLRLTNLLRLAYFQNAFDREKIKVQLQHMQSQSNYPAVQAYALMCLKQVDQDLKGKIISDIELEDLRGKSWSLKKNLDRYTYIYFFNESVQCKKELSFLNKIQDNYADAIEIFAVYVGKENSYLQEIHNTYGSELSLLTTNFDFKTLYELQISSLPSAMQMNAKGEVMYSYTFLPSEKIIKEWNGIMRKR